MGPVARARDGSSNGRIFGVIVTMDSAGRLVIPRDVRREAGLEPGVPLRIRLREGIVEIEPEPLPVRLSRKGRLLVASPTQPTPPLRAAAVERTRDTLRGGTSSGRRTRR